MVFTDSELSYLATQRLGRIATQQPNGTLQVSPVGFRYNPDTETIDVYGFGMEKSRKYRNIADNGRVAFVVDDLASTQPWRPRCVEIRGHAEATTGANGAPMIRITPERIISFGLEETNTPAHQLRTDSRKVG
ncbi:PPOX class F420-dependent oxidoreductase [Microbacterium sp. ASV49]|uniref:PPOX class F420-dependent oxidoreductase n=1 Tax=Microbacterium candidum TaxID=3041922 RepID=A0ABT7MWN1_9MICO|nr:PPOX class F420-dependent oxidoreductase [Microbacterium sp. ASV49]MDL9978862.1 PPOX class F420-dependent oxidoreductase [Microbacterium sp. ASV49]